MVEKSIISSRNVIDFVLYPHNRANGKVPAFSVQLCRHCGAPLLDGESEDDCSSTFNFAARYLR
jgi:hypothetical protein